ncbi:MAG: HAMP domain-containing sensor histidine kinase [Pirellulales bacterium]
MVILTALVTLIGLRQGVQWAILHEMDRILIEDFEEITLALDELSQEDFTVLTDELNRKAIGHKHHGWFVQLLSSDELPVWSSFDTPETLPPVTSIQSHPHSVNNYRILQQDVDIGTNGVATVRLGATLNFFREDTARIDRLVLLGVGCVLIVAPLVGYWLAGRATQTVGEIIATAERLRPSHLEERLPIRGTGDELDRLAITINSLLDRIGEHLQHRRDFLANAAHELRTPLAAIRSSVEVALSSDRSNEEYQDLLVEIINQGMSLETLVNQLLLISESEAERLKMDPAPVAFDEVVRRSADMFAGTAESRNITLDVNIPRPVTIRGNRHLLRQLINNLIDNAIKYTPRGGRVGVDLQLNNPQDIVILTVTDTGIGIAEEDHLKVFDRFFRADKSRTRMSQTAGTGLGLSICQAAAAAHDGEIRCESELGNGSRFVVEIPLSSQAAHPQDTPKRPSPSSAS